MTFWPAQTLNSDSSSRNKSNQERRNHLAAKITSRVWKADSAEPMTIPGILIPAEIRSTSTTAFTTALTFRSRIPRFRRLFSVEICAGQGKSWAFLALSPSKGQLIAAICWTRFWALGQTKRAAFSQATNTYCWEGRSRKAQFGVKRADYLFFYFDPNIGRMLLIIVFMYQYMIYNLQSNVWYLICKADGITAAEWMKRYELLA